MQHGLAASELLFAAALHASNMQKKSRPCEIWGRSYFRKLDSAGGLLHALRAAAQSQRNHNLAWLVSSVCRLWGLLLFVTDHFLSFRVHVYEDHHKCYIMVTTL